MSPLPKVLTDRWENRTDVPSGLGVVYWHVLLGKCRQVREMAEEVQERLSKFDGLHMTPLQWLHVTILVAGGTDAVGDSEMKQMLVHAQRHLSGVSPIAVSLGRILYHPEAIMFDIQPGHAMDPILEAAQSATRAVIGKGGAFGSAVSGQWRPHITFCYSTDMQPAEPIISTLGMKVSGCEVSIDTLDLVIQHGPERMWNWHPVGAALLSGNSQSREEGQLTKSYPCL